MKVARLMNFGEKYLTHFSMNTGLAEDLSWIEQWRRLAGDRFGFSDSWEEALRAEGVDAVDLPHGVSFIDISYAAETGARSDPMAATVHRLKSFSPDVLFLSSLESWTTAQLSVIRNEVRSIRSVVGMAGVNIAYMPVLRQTDVFLTCMKGFAADLRSEGLDARVVPHAFDPRVLDSIKGTHERRDGFAFFGNVVPGPHYHDERLVLLERLAQKVGLVIYSDPIFASGALTTRYVEQSLAHMMGKLTSALPGALANKVPGRAMWQQAADWPRAPRLLSHAALRRHRRPAVYGLEMYRAMASTELTINMHIGGAGPYAANMRLFEATGAGACLLTDAKSDLAEFFETDVEVVSYSSVGEAEDKARYLLDHPDEMLAIGRAGQRRTLASHTYQHRAPIVASALKAALDRNRSSAR